MTPPPQQAPTAAAPHTYGQILKSSVLIGGSSALNLALGIVRVKAIALILGPSGIGLIGLYTSIVTLAQNVAGLGVNNSGVRQIAAAVGTGDTELIARTAAVLRRVSVALGLAGAAVLLVAGAAGVAAHVRQRGARATRWASSPWPCSCSWSAAASPPSSRGSGAWATWRGSRCSAASWGRWPASPSSTRSSSAASCRR